MPLAVLTEHRNTRLCGDLGEVGRPQVGLTRVEPRVALSDRQE